MGSCRSSACPALEEPVRGFSGLGRGSPPSSGEGQLEPERAQVPRSRIPLEPEPRRRRGGFTCTAKLFGWQSKGADNRVMETPAVFIKTEG